MFSSLISLTAVTTSMMLSPVLLAANDSTEKNLSSLPPYTAIGKDVSQHNFDGANLELSNFSGAVAEKASFRNANLAYANLSIAKLNGTDLTGANLKFALIEFTELENAVGLTPEQLAVACIPRVLEEEKLSVEGFDPVTYQLPEGCLIWEQVPRG